MNNKSFTLIELLVVIVIIGILAGVIIVSTSSSISKANIAKLKVFEESVSNNLSANMVARWNLDSNANDLWGSNNGTTTNVTYGPGYDEKINGAGIFNGSSSFIRISYKPEFNLRSNISAFCWVKGNAQSNRQILAQYDTGTNQRAWTLYTEATFTNKLAIIISSNGTFDAGYYKTYYTNNIVFDNNWHYVGFTWSNGTLKIYIDGLEAAVTKQYDASFAVMHNSNADLTIGSRLDSNSPAYFFAGSLDDVRIYDAALSSLKIKQNYIAGLNLMFASGSMSKEEYNQRVESLVSNIK